MPCKIPIEFLLKASRQECGELKSYIQELEDSIKERDKLILNLQKKNKQLQKLQRNNSVNVQVDNKLSGFISNKNQLENLLPLKRSKRKCNLYKKMTKTYNAWYNGCKVLITLMGELRSPSKPSSETT